MASLSSELGKSTSAHDLQPGSTFVSIPFSKRRRTSDLEMYGGVSSYPSPHSCLTDLEAKQFVLHQCGQEVTPESASTIEQAVPTCQPVNRVAAKCALHAVPKR
jgi:hypothetical protein